MNRLSIHHCLRTACSKCPQTPRTASAVCGHGMHEWYDAHKMHASKNVSQAPAGLRHSHEAAQVGHVALEALHATEASEGVGKQTAADRSLTSYCIAVHTHSTVLCVHHNAHRQCSAVRVTGNMHW